MAFIDELFSGVGSVATAAWKASPPGSKLHRMDRADKQNDLQNDFRVLKEIDNPEDQQRHLQDMVKKYPKLVQLSSQMSDVMTQTLKEQAEGSSNQDEAKKMLDNLKAISALTGEDDEDNAIFGAEIDKGLRQVVDLLGIKSEPQQQPEKASLTQMYPGLAGTGDSSAGTPQQQPAQQPGHSFSPGATQQPPAPVDNRGMFAGDENPFNLTPESQAKVDSFLEEDLSPKQSPHTFEDIGITLGKNQREFQELEELVKGQIPGMDLRQAYALHPESYKKLFAAIQNGVPDQEGGTRKLTTKEIMQAIQSMGR
jgi:hypothetical protein